MNNRKISKRERQRAAQGASEIEELEAHVVSQTCLGQNITQAPIRASFIRDSCSAHGITTQGSAPVLALCRALVAAGHDPAMPLEAWRGHVLALSIRSIGEGARLTVDEHNGTRFAKWRPFCHSAVPPRIAPFERAATTLARAAP
jgi:hypothetical protein